MRAGFEWLVAWRHLRDLDHNKSHRTLVTGVLLLVLGLVAKLPAEQAPALLGLHAVAPGEWREARAAEWVGYVAFGSRVSMGLGGDRHPAGRCCFRSSRCSRPCRSSACSWARRRRSSRCR